MAERMIGIEVVVRVEDDDELQQVADAIADAVEEVDAVVGFDMFELTDDEDDE